MRFSPQGKTGMAPRNACSSLWGPKQPRISSEAAGVRTLRAHLHHVSPRPSATRVFSCPGHSRGFEPMRSKAVKLTSRHFASRRPGCFKPKCRATPDLLHSALAKCTKSGVARHFRRNRTASPKPLFAKFLVMSSREIAAAIPFSKNVARPPIPCIWAMRNARDRGSRAHWGPPR